MRKGGIWEGMIADEEEGLSGDIFMSKSINSCFISADNILQWNAETAFQQLFVFFTIIFYGLLTKQRKQHFSNYSMCWIGMDPNRKRNAFCLLGNSPAKAGFWKGNLIWKSSHQCLQICLSGHARVNFWSRQERQGQEPGVNQWWPLTVWRGHRGSGSHVLQGWPGTGNVVRWCRVPRPEQLRVNCLLLLYTLITVLTVLFLISLLFLKNCLCLSLWSLPFCASNSALQQEGRSERAVPQFSEVFQWEYEIEEYQS